MLVGPTYQTRLWCILEVFTYLMMTPSREGSQGLVIEPFAENSDALTRVLIGLRVLDAAKASCFHAMDQQRILAVIEAGYGSLSAFNRSLQAIVRKELEGSDDQGMRVVLSV